MNIHQPSQSFASQPPPNALNESKQSFSFQDELENCMDELSSEQQIVALNKTMGSSLNELKKALHLIRYMKTIDDPILQALSTLTDTLIQDLKKGVPDGALNDILALFDLVESRSPALESIKRKLQYLTIKK
jgi:hypothetical protein